MKTTLSEMKIITPVAIIVAIIGIVVFSAVIQASPPPPPPPSVSLDRPWIYATPDDLSKFTVTLDQKINQNLPAVDLVVKIYSVVCDNKCRFEEIPHKDGLGTEESSRLNFGTTTPDAVTNAHIKYPIENIVQNGWPSHAQTNQKALVVARLANASNTTVKSGDEAFRFPHLLSVNNLTIVEGEKAEIVVRLRENVKTNQPIRVSYKLKDETAIWNEDYWAKPSGAINIPAGRQKGTLLIKSADNDTFGNTTFRIELSDPPDRPFTILNIGDGGLITIVENDEPYPTLTLASVQERRTAGHVHSDYRFEIDPVSEAPVNIEYSPVVRRLAENGGGYDDTEVIVNPKEFRIESGQAFATLSVPTAKIDYELRFRTIIRVLSVKGAKYDGTLGENIPQIKDESEPAPVPEPVPTPENTSLPVVSIENNAWGLYSDVQDRIYKLNLDKPATENATVGLSISFYEIICDGKCHLKKFPHKELKQAFPISKGKRAPDLVHLTALLPGFSYANLPADREFVWFAEPVESETKGVSIGYTASLPAVINYSLDSELAEGNFGQVTLRMDSTRETPVHVSYKFVDDSAVNGRHYQAASSGSATFSPGEIRTRIPYMAPQNNFRSGETEFGIELLSSGNISALFVNVDENGDAKPNTKVEEKVKVIDNEGTPIVAIVSVKEENGKYHYKFNMSHPSEETIKIAFHLYADGGILYTLPLCVFPPGETTYSVVVNSADYPEIEDPWTIHIEGLRAGNAVVLFGGAIWSFDLNGDLSVNFVYEKLWQDPLLKPKGAFIEAENGRVDEGDVAEIKFTLNKPLDQDLEVTYAVREIDRSMGLDPANLAIRDGDFKHEKRNITILAGDTSTLAYVWTRDDQHQEIDEIFAVQIIELSQDGIETVDGFVTITDNDDAPEIYIKSARIITVDGVEMVLIELRMTSRSDWTVDAKLTALDRKDLSKASEVANVTVSFPPRVTKRNITLILEEPD